MTSGLQTHSGGLSTRGGGLAAGPTCCCGVAPCNLCGDGPTPATFDLTITGVDAAQPACLAVVINGTTYYCTIRNPYTFDGAHSLAQTDDACCWIKDAVLADTWLDRYSDSGCTSLVDSSPLTSAHLRVGDSSCTWPLTSCSCSGGTGSPVVLAYRGTTAWSEDFHDCNLTPPFSPPCLTTSTRTVPLDVVLFSGSEDVNCASSVTHSNDFASDSDIACASSITCPAGPCSSTCRHIITVTSAASVQVDPG
jgi:hypothetical protein